MANFKTDRVSDWRRQQAVEMRTEKKMTYQQIADAMGVSKAYVGLLLKEVVKNPRFHPIGEDRLPYPRLVKWMNDNQVTHIELARRMGYAVTGSPTIYLTEKIRKGTLRKNDIDKLLKITGMSYEKLFGATS